MYLRQDKPMLLEVLCMTHQLNGLEGVQPWDFTAVTILEQQLEYQLNGLFEQPDIDEGIKTAGGGDGQEEEPISSRVSYTHLRLLSRDAVQP